MGKKRKYIQREVLKGYVNRHQAWQLMKEFLGNNMWSVVTFYDQLDKSELKKTWLGKRPLYRFTDIVRTMPLEKEIIVKVIAQYIDKQAKEQIG